MAAPFDLRQTRSLADRIATPPDHRQTRSLADRIATPPDYRLLSASARGAPSALLFVLAHQVNALLVAAFS